MGELPTIAELNALIDEELAQPGGWHRTFREISEAVCRRLPPLPNGVESSARRAKVSVVAARRVLEMPREGRGDG